MNERKKERKKKELERKKGAGRAFGHAAPAAGRG
jgi:hypothetical protein